MESQWARPRRFEKRQGDSSSSLRSVYGGSATMITMNGRLMVDIHDPADCEGGRRVSAIFLGMSSALTYV